MNEQVKYLVHFLYELGTLRKIARSHRQTLLTDDLSDNIASHSYRTTMIGWFLAKLEMADANKVVIMCLFHDTAETRTGDQNWVNKKYIKVFEDEAIRDQFTHLPGDNDLENITTEYKARETIEAKLAKDADLIDQLLLLKEYSRRGNQEADNWLSSQESFKRIYSESAKKIAKEILEQNPSDWWTKSGWSADRR